MKLLLFDIDGTLLRAGPSSEHAFEAAFEELFGIAHSWGSTQPHGRTDPDIVQEICFNSLGRYASAQEYKTLTDSYAKRLEPIMQDCEKYQILPGVEKLCEQLHKDSSVALALETGNIEAAAYVKLRRGSLDSYFPVGGFGSDHKERSEIIRISSERAVSHYGLGAIDPARDVVVIGDAPQDVAAGKAFGAKTIAVATGRHSKEELLEFQADHTLESLADTASFLKLCGISG